MRTVLSQGEQSNQNMLPCYDEAGKQRVSEAGKGRVHTGHTTVHLTPISGPGLLLSMAPCCLSYKRATWGVMFQSLVLKQTTTHRFPPQVYITLPLSFIMEGEEGDSGYLFHLENFERRLQISRELSNSPINILTQAKVLFSPVTKPRAERSITLCCRGGGNEPSFGSRTKDSKRKQDSMLKALRGWDRQVLSLSAGGVHIAGERATRHTSNTLRAYLYLGV